MRDGWVSLHCADRRKVLFPLLSSRSQKHQVAVQLWASGLRQPETLVLRLLDGCSGGPKSFKNLCRFVVFMSTLFIDQEGIQDGSF
jgi:hypothetical protein